MIQAREHIGAGYHWVVDLDLEKFFDRVNHDVLMSRIEKRVSDKRVLSLIRRHHECRGDGRRSGKAGDRRNAAGRPTVAAAIEPAA
ncbi:hypothetical protein ACUY33_000332 [Escherichia coli]